MTTTKGRPRPTGKIISEAEFRRLWGDLGTTVAQIGERLGIGQQAVTARAKKWGFPPRPKRGAKPACNPDHLRRLYLAGVTQPDIAKVLGCDRKTVHNTIVRLGLPKRGHGKWAATSLDDFRDIQLREAMAQDAAKCRVQFAAAEMLDNYRPPRLPAKVAA